MWIPRAAAALALGVICGCAAETGAVDADRGENAAQTESALGSCGVTIDPLRSIEIVHPHVMDDARTSNLTAGPWSFRTLITNMARSTATADVDAFVRDIFESWLTDQIENGQLMTARPSVDQVILSRFAIAGSSPRRFDLSLAPFQLIAIANRLDLRSATTAGEGRFIFGLTLPTGGSSKGGFQSMTVIFEYALPLVAPLDTPAKWAAKWHELDVLDPETAPAAFNAKLQEITDRFTVRNAFVSRPNGSAINQVRTNEIALGSVWQLREFNMTSSGRMLPSSTKNSPNHVSINASQALLDFLNATPALGSTNDASFMSVQMPAMFNGNLFLGSRADETFSERWSLSNGETQDNSPRVDNLGLLTCNGCHSENKTATDIAFYQVSPLAGTFNPNTAQNDGSGRLSQFMLVGDPSKGGRRPSEFSRRASDMANLLCTAALPDLVVASVGWSPGNLAAGQPATFSAVVRNNGKTATPAGVKHGVAFHVDGNLVTWSDDNTQSLAPGASVTLTANSGPVGSKFWNATSGRHTLLAWVDDVNRMAENDETNNKLFVPLDVGIDLTVTNIKLSPTNPSAGQPVTFSATVKNEGTIATPQGVIIGVAFHVDGSLVTWSDNTSSSLGAGQSITVTSNFGPTASSTWPARSGTHTLLAWVDDVNRMNDVNRSNNRIQTAIAIP